jgi:fermentation-respiration switch protein FrsA (DUF1100 family)
LCGLILENTFTSIHDLLSVYSPYVAKLKFLLRDTWKSSHFIEKINIPILFLSGSADSLVPPSMMEALHTKVKNSQFVKIVDGDHNDTWQQKGYMEYVKEFVENTINERV